MTPVAPPIATLPGVPPSVGLPFADAHNSCAIQPGHALVYVRAALAALTDIWLRHLLKGTGGTLAEQADRLVRALGLGRTAGQIFHDVRYMGNLGAHPEQRTSGPPTRAEAREALVKLHTLICLYLERALGRAAGELPEFVEPPEIHWGEVCERAIFLRDPVAMVAVGRRLRSEARSAMDAGGRAPGREEAVARLPQDVGFRDALLWFERAAPRAVDADLRRDADYECARLIIVDLPLDDQLEPALGVLRSAADAGHSSAQALLAQLLLDPFSPLPSPRDLAEARAWAEKAALAEHPEALNALTAIYANGDGVARDPARALAYARRASGAGYPLAHANLALLLLESPATGLRDQEIRQLIDRARAADVPEAWWADYRLSTEGMTPDPAAAEVALGAAVVARVLPALLWASELHLRQDGSRWELARVSDWLIDVLGQVGEGYHRDLARNMLRRVRDEGDRRMRAPVGRETGPRGNDLFALVIHAGACLDRRPGEDPVVLADRVMRALGRVCSPMAVGRPATEEDVGLILDAVPNFPVNWTRGRAVLVDPLSAGEDGEGTGRHEPKPPNKVPQSRNALCACGSGKKYKACCGREDRGVSGR